MYEDPFALCMIMNSNNGVNLSRQIPNLVRSGGTPQEWYD